MARLREVCEGQLAAAGALERLEGSEASVTLGVEALVRELDRTRFDGAATETALSGIAETGRSTDRTLQSIRRELSSLNGTVESLVTSMMASAPRGPAEEERGRAEEVEQGEEAGGNGIADSGAEPVPPTER